MTGGQLNNKSVHSPNAPKALMKTCDIASHVGHTGNKLGILLLALTTEQLFQSTDADSSREQIDTSLLAVGHLGLVWGNSLPT